MNQFIGSGSLASELLVLLIDGVEEEAVVQGTVSGGVAINDVLAHIMQDDAPFGGVGDSGTGSYHGYEGFINFSHSKTVFSQTPYEFPLKITRPPYGAGIRRFLDIMIRIKWERDKQPLLKV